MGLLRERFDAATATFLDSGDSSVFHCRIQLLKEAQCLPREYISSADIEKFFLKAECHWMEVKRILRFFEGIVNTTLILGNNTLIPEVPKGLVCGYFDSAFMDNTMDRHSTTGYFFFLNRSNLSMR